MYLAHADAQRLMESVTFVSAPGCVYIYVYTCVYIYIYAYTYICLCIFMCVCICIEFIYRFIESIVSLFSYPFIYSFIYLFSCLFIHLFLYCFVQSTFSFRSAVFHDAVCAAYHQERIFFLSVHVFNIFSFISFLTYSFIGLYVIVRGLLKEYQFVL